VQTYRRNPVTRAEKLIGILKELGLSQEMADSLADKTPEEILQSNGIPEELRYQGLARMYGMPYVNPDENPPDPSVIGLLPNTMISSFKVFPFKLQGSELWVLTAAPGDLQSLNEIRQVLSRENRRLKPAITTPSALGRLIEQHKMRSVTSEQLRNYSESRKRQDQPTVVSTSAHEDEGPIAAYVNGLIKNALLDGASDIHIEPSNEGLRVRMRVDGRLFVYDNEVPPNLASEIITRIMIMAGMDIAERRQPQDGRITFKSGEHEVNLRVSTGPVKVGHKKSDSQQVVMRLLPREDEIPQLEDLGFLPDVLAQFRKVAGLANGLILVTGPTGSGKSTTLAAIVSEIATDERKTLSVEDPVEYQIRGVVQTQVNEAAGYTFAKALRSFLRQDPDVIYVGEIRDAETAKIAIEAALTGHLVFGTLHTNDAVESVSRLEQLGVESFNLSSSMRGVLAQRLVRKVCPRCRAPHPQAEHFARIIEGELGRSIDPNLITKGKGCPHCRNTGYKGRTAIHELFIVDREMAEAIAAGEDTSQLRKRALAQGMRPLRSDGFEKVLMGMTTPEEVIAASLE